MSSPLPRNRCWKRLEATPAGRTRPSTPPAAADSALAAPPGGAALARGVTGRTACRPSNTHSQAVPFDKIRSTCWPRHMHGLHGMETTAKHAASQGGDQAAVQWRLFRS